MATNNIFTRHRRSAGFNFNPLNWLSELTIASEWFTSGIVFRGEDESEDCSCSCDRLDERENIREGLARRGLI
jgi:hypothetical protein